MKKFDNIPDLVSMMERYVKRQVKHYRTDFYDYDLPMLQGMKSGQYMWITRDCGTHLVRIDGEQGEKAAADDKYYVSVIADVYGPDSINPYCITAGPSGITFKRVSRNRLQEFCRV